MKKLILLIGIAFLLPATMYAATGINHNLPDCAKYGFTCLGVNDTRTLAEYKAYMAERVATTTIQPTTVQKSIVKKTISPTKNVYPPFPGIRMCLR